MDEATFWQRHQGGKRDFSWADLQGLNLEGAQLAGISFSRANLARANLRQADLSEANCVRANLEAADLSGANLTRANFRKANLQNACLENAVTEGSNFQGAILSDGSIEPMTPLVVQVEEPVDLKTEQSDLRESDNTEPFASPEAERALENPDDTADLSEESEAHQLILLSLLALTFGYTCFGMLLGQYEANLFYWMLVWASAFLGVWNEVWIWFVPLGAAVGAVLAIGIGAKSLVFAALASLGAFVGIWLAGSIMGWASQERLRNSLWVTGLVFIIHKLSLLLIAGTICVGLGSLATLQMTVQRYPRSQIFQRLALAATLGLAAGNLFR